MSQISELYYRAVRMSVYIMRTNDKAGATTKTVETAFQLLEYVKAQDGSTLGDITAEFDLAKSTAHRHMSTLENLGYLVREGGRYYPSTRFLDIGAYVKNRKDLFKLAQPKVDELAEETGEQVQFLVEEHGRGMTVHRASGTQAVQTNPGLGKPIPLHTNAAGKAILAQMSDEEIEELIDAYGLQRETEHTITNKEELLQDIERVRERGYSTNEQERTPGLRAVGVPIQAPNDFSNSSISISGPANRMKGKRFTEEIPDLLRGTANEIELNLSDNSIDS